MINTSTVKNTEKTFTSKYLEPGHFKVRINNITVYTAQSGSNQFRFELETPPVLTEGFTPAEGHTGQVGTVKTVYISNPSMEEEVGKLIASLADTLNVRNEVNNLSSDLTYEEYAKALHDILKDKYFYVSISGKEYTNSKNGKTGVELQFSRYKTFGSVSDVEEKGAEKVLGKIYIKKLTPTTEQPKEEALF